MTEMLRNDDPPCEDSAYEVKIDGVWFAWDDDGHVYMQHKNAMREDGYMLVGFYDGDIDGFARYAKEVSNAGIHRAPENRTENAQRAPADCQDQMPRLR